MRHRHWPLRDLLVVAITAAAVAPAAIAQGPQPATAQAPQVITPKANYKAPRTPWGHPDFQGTWTSDSVAGVPIEKPLQNASPEALARQKRLRDLESKIDASGSNVVFDERPLKWTIQRPAALVTDPPDGRVPLSAEMQKLLDDTTLLRYGFGVGSWTDLDLWDRCLTKGYPTVMLPMGYSNLYQIAQSPDTFAINAEVIHDTRIVPLDGRPHIDSKIRQYWGDSRGHWEGDTLVIEITNFSDKTFGTQQPAGNYRGGGKDMKIIERIRRTDDRILEYSARIEDPRAFTRPWTLTIPLVKDDSQMFEYACHEGNYGIANILSAALKRPRTAPEGFKH
jgi:hypothetical protein